MGNTAAGLPLPCNSVSTISCLLTARFRAWRTRTSFTRTRLVVSRKGVEVDPHPTLGCGSSAILNPALVMSGTSSREIRAKST